MVTLGGKEVLSNHVNEDTKGGHRKCPYERGVFIKLRRIEPRSHFINRLSMIVRVNVVLNRAFVVDGE